MADYIYYNNEDGIYRVKVEYDDYAECPREWYEHEATHMHIWWRDYEYHDDGNNMDADELLEQLMFDESDISEDAIYEMTTMEKINYLRENHDYVFISINGYEHGGFTISTSGAYPYSCPWDGGSAGFIYTSKKEILLRLGLTDKDDWKEQAIALLEAEIKEYDQWLTGDVYYAISEKLVDEEWIDDESCGGIYSDKYGDELIMECADVIGLYPDHVVSERWVEAVIAQREEERIKKEKLEEKNRLALLEKFEDKVRSIYDKYHINAEDLQTLVIAEGR